MTTHAQRIAFAEVCGYQWYCIRDNPDIVRDHWGLPRLAFPPEGGIGSPAWKWTVSETRAATEAEIAVAKNDPNTFIAAPWPSDMAEVHRHLMALCLNRPDIVEFRSNQDLIQEQIDLLCEEGQIPAWMLSSERLVEAVLRAAGRWEEET